MSDAAQLQQADAEFEAPDWFRADDHVVTLAGIIERSTGLVLAGDGLPLAGVPRVHRLVDQDAAEDPLEIVPTSALAAERERRAALAAAEYQRRAAEEEAEREAARAARADAKAARETAKAGNSDAGTGGDAEKKD